MLGVEEVREDRLERKDVDAGLGVEINGHELVEGGVVCGSFGGGPFEPVFVGFTGELVDGMSTVGGVSVLIVGKEGWEVDEVGKSGDEA